MKNFMRQISLLVILGLFIFNLAACSGSSSSRNPNLQSNEHQADAFINLAAVLIIGGENTRALNELIIAKEKDPNRWDLYNYFGLAYSGLNQLDLAIENYNKSLSLKPNNSEVINNLGRIYMIKNDYNKAIALFEECIKDLTYEKAFLPLTNIAIAYLMQGDQEKAKTFFHKAIETNKDYPAPYFYLGELEFKRKNYGEALAYLQISSKLDSQDINTQWLLAETYEAMGQKENAARAYGDVAVLMPNTPIGIKATAKARALMGF